MRKILFCLSLILLLFLQVFSDEIEIDLLYLEGNEFAYSLSTVLDNESSVNLPFLIFSFDEKFSFVRIDSFRFFEQEEKKDFYVTSFSGNIPLSSKQTVAEKKSTDDFSEKLVSGKNSKTIKIFPFRQKDSKLTFFKKLRIFFTPSFKVQAKSEAVYDYLIICDAKYDTAFERLKQWKTRRGFKTRIITTDSIFNASSGIDSAEKLRNFIVQEYNASSFKYLLLGGDRATIPVRRMFAMDCNADYYPDEDSIPADIYYSNLEGTFDFDNDGIYGEIEDSCDMTSEVLLGRILFDTIYYGPSPIITRIIDYEQTKETEHLNRGMFMGMILWNPPFTPGGEAKEMIFNDIIPSAYHIKKFYEHWGHSGKLDILDSMDMGYGIVNHNGHGSFKGIWVDTLTSLSRGDMTGLTNYSKTGLFYSIGCWVGAFDRDNTTYNLHSITQNMQDSPTGGFISIITNSRYGWGAPGYPGYGVSDMLDYRFFTFLFNDECKEPAYLLNKLKNEISVLSEDENLYRWHMYELNYFGDPSTSIYTKYPDSLKMSLKRIGNEIYVKIKGIDQAPAENVLVCISNDTIIGRGYTDANGIFVCDLSSLTDSSAYITVTGTNKVTITDSFNFFLSDSSYVSAECDTLYSGAENVIQLFNSHSSNLTVNLLSAFIDTTFELIGRDSAAVGYSPLYSAERTDTIYMSVIESGETDTLISNVKRSSVDFDSLKFDNTVFKAVVSKNHSKTIKGAEMRIVLAGTDTLLDTLITCDFYDFISLSEATGIPTGLSYLTADIYLSKSGTLLSHVKEYLNNGEVIFSDDFSSDLSKWEYKSANWLINANSQLYAGADNKYLNNMDDSIVSDEFLIYPGTICSLYIDAYLPSLEFIDDSIPVFDLDGLFIKLIKDGADTSILDFVSSGGALSKEPAMRIKGWREYVFNPTSVENANIFLQFISDSVITDSGVYISNIKISPKFYYAESTSITREDKNVIGRDKIKYSITGIPGDVDIKIITIDGRVIKQYNLNNAPSAELSFSGVPSGVYFVIFEAGKTVFKDKLIILK